MLPFEPQKREKTNQYFSNKIITYNELISARRKLQNTNILALALLEKNWCASSDKLVKIVKQLNTQFLSINYPQI
jgi:hypothetical protein